VSETNRIEIGMTGLGALPAEYQYCVYGITVHSEIPLALPELREGGLAQVQIRTAPAALFEGAIQGVELQGDPDSWYQYAFLPDGSTYARWQGVGEFLVTADGTRIVCRPQQKSSAESFQVYMLGQALSFALVKQGFEPLHATVVVIEGKAVAFLGESGYGKSTMAASLLAAGYRLLTDDLLILRDTPEGLLAYPGPPRIKAFPKIARKFLGAQAARVRMNPDTRKLIIPLSPDHLCSVPVSLGAIYSIAPSAKTARAKRPRIESITLRDAFLELVSHTFNYRIVNPARLQRQFLAYADIVDSMPVRKLHYPRVLGKIEQVHEMILADLTSASQPSSERPIGVNPYTSAHSEAVVCG
jgi:hypothetical protein